MVQENGDSEVRRQTSMSRNDDCILSLPVWWIFADLERFDPIGAKFLILCIEYFEYENTSTRGLLTSVHWNGTRQQLGGHLLFAVNGLICDGDGEGGYRVFTGPNAENDRKDAYWDRWLQMKNQNMWYDFFPKTKNEWLTNCISNSDNSVYSSGPDN